MAGMLPGVEAARRRRIHHRGGGGNGSSEMSGGGLVGGYGCTRRPVFCLFTTSFEANPLSAISMGRSGMNRTCEDEMLGQLAREAKERLDGRLKAQRSSFINRVKSEQCEDRVKSLDGRTMMIRDLQTEVYGGSMKKKTMFTRWAIKLGRKKAREVEEDEEECAVCLEHFRIGETLMNLQCKHRFHSSCLVPWLQHRNLCPCCRMSVLP